MKLACSRAADPHIHHGLKKTCAIPGSKNTSKVNEAKAEKSTRWKLNAYLSRFTARRLSLTLALSICLLIGNTQSRSINNQDQHVYGKKGKSEILR